MSAIITFGNNLYANKIRRGLNQNDDVLQGSNYSANEPATTIGRAQDVDILWTRSTFSKSFSAGSDGAEDCMSQRWEWYWPLTGCNVRKVVSGVVKDSNGDPVSGATVKLFNTATGLLVDTQTSAADGSYSCGDPNNVASFAVAYHTGSPDTAGTTVNTVAGT